MKTLFISALIAFAPLVSSANVKNINCNINHDNGSSGTNLRIGDVLISVDSGELGYHFVGNIESVNVKDSMEYIIEDGNFVNANFAVAVRGRNSHEVVSLMVGTIKNRNIEISDSKSWFLSFGEKSSTLGIISCSL